MNKPSIYNMLAVLVVCLLLLWVLWCAIEFTDASRKKARNMRCKENLKVLENGILIYSEEHFRPPDANGAGFITRLYQTKYVTDLSIYLCPETEDTILEEQILATTMEDKNNVVSYAGRKNKTVGYPTLFGYFHTVHTSVISDDIQGRKNHETHMNFVFDTGTVNSHPKEDYQILFDPLTN